jgi:small subunit ribosomal protein S6
MKRNNYESCVIINAALEDAQIEAILKLIEDTISSNGGEIIDIEKWGRKRLAYAIRKSKSGYYAFFRFSASPELIEKLERVYRLEENIVRFLTLLMDKKFWQYYQNQKVSQQNNLASDSNQSTYVEETEADYQLSNQSEIDQN